MRYIVLCMTVFFLIGILGCSSLQVTSDYDSKVDFQSLKTYAWNSSQEKPQTSHEKILDEKIRAAIEKELAAKDFVKAEGVQPDFFIKYKAAVETQIETSNLEDFGIHYTQLSHTRFDSARRNVSTRYYELGTLVIETVDAKTLLSLWRGSAQAELDEKANDEKREQNLQNAISQILSRFPPK